MFPQLHKYMYVCLGRYHSVGKCSFVRKVRTEICGIYDVFCPQTSITQPVHCPYKYRISIFAWAVTVLLGCVLLFGNSGGSFGEPTRSLASTMSVTQLVHCPHNDTTSMCAQAGTTLLGSVLFSGKSGLSLGTHNVCLTTGVLSHNS